MAAKTTGAEFKRFYVDNDFWPDGVWHEDEFLIVDGEEYEGEVSKLEDHAKVSINGGSVMFDGPDGKCPWGDKDGPSFEAYFKRWRKKQTTGFVVVEFDLSKREAVFDAIKAAGGKVSV